MRNYLKDYQHYNGVRRNHCHKQDSLIELFDCVEYIYIGSNDEGRVVTYSSYPGWYHTTEPRRMSQFVDMKTNSVIDYDRFSEVTRDEMMKLLEANKLVQFNILNARADKVTHAVAVYPGAFFRDQVRGIYVNRRRQSAPLSDYNLGDDPSNVYVVLKNEGNSWDSWDSLGGGLKKADSTKKRTNDTITFKGKECNVFVGPRGGRYVMYNRSFVLIK